MNLIREKTYIGRLKTSLRGRGLLKTIRAILVTILFPLYRKFTLDKFFVFRGEKLRYFLHPYNFSWENERCVEIPIFYKFVNRALSKNLSVLEVGNVLRNYYPESTPWEIVDKYEEGEYVVNEDIITYSTNKKYDLLFSISTLEHIGFDYFEENDPEKVNLAIQNSISMLSRNGTFIFSIPIGWNPGLDEKIFSNIYNCSEIICFKRIAFRQWIEVDMSEIRNSKLNSPYRNANGLVIGFIQK